MPRNDPLTTAAAGTQARRIAGRTAEQPHTPARRRSGARLASVESGVTRERILDDRLDALGLPREPQRPRAGASVKSAHPLDRSPVSARFRCGACTTVSRVEPAADAFWCASCGSDNSFRECGHCRVWSVVASPYGQPASGWTCEACTRVNAVSVDGSLPMRWRHGAAVLNEWPTRYGGPRPLVALSGFTITAGEEPRVPVGAPCALAVHEDGIEVIVSGQRFFLVFPFDKLDTFELSGRRPHPLAPADGRVASGAPGLPRALATDSIVRLGRGEKRFEAVNGEHSLARLRSAFAGALARWDARRATLRADDPQALDAELEELNELNRICEVGEISRTEYHVVRALVLKRITGRDT